MYFNLKVLKDNEHQGSNHSKQNGVDDISVDNLACNRA